MAATLSDTVGERGLGWGPALGILAAVLAAFVAMYLVTVMPMVGIWMASDTYAHGAIIAPISLWLTWEKRAVLAKAGPRPTLVPALLMLPLGALWLIAHLGGVALIEQYAFVGLLILAIWALVGTPVARFLAFPLGFLLLAVPVGFGLMYPMMNFTADFTVGALRLSGIPVYRDGTFFSIPSGDWSVVEACSGLRYLLAAVTLGVLYAYLTYSKLWKRLIFIVFSVLIPVLANGVRAYLIVMIGHLSGMQLAVGVDHLIYGWIFFGIVVTIMFAVGALWRDPVPEDERVEDSGAAQGRGLLRVAAAVLTVGALWASVAWAADRPFTGGSAPLRLVAPASAGAWVERPGASLWDWRPHVVGTDGQTMTFFESGAKVASLYLGVYRTQRPGSEAVNALNQMVLQDDAIWSDKEITTRRIETPGGPLTVSQHRLASRGGARLLVWSWYRVGAFQTGDGLKAKLAELGYRLIGGRRDATIVALATPYEGDPETAAAVLAGLVSDLVPAAEAAIDRALSAAP